LTDAIRAAHVRSRGTYGARRIHAELTLGQGLTVGHNAVEMLMQRAGIKGVSGRPRWRRGQFDTIASDLVDRQFSRTGPNQLWVTDIERHEALEPSGGERPSPPGRRSGPVVAGGSLIGRRR